jgi:hypothetical protein
MRRKAHAESSMVKGGPILPNRDSLAKPRDPGRLTSVKVFLGNPGTC